MRNTSTPASISSRKRSSDALAGPTVATILVRFHMRTSPWIGVELKNGRKSNLEVSEPFCQMRTAYGKPHSTKKLEGWNIEYRTRNDECRRKRRRRRREWWWSPEGANTYQPRARQCEMRELCRRPGYEYQWNLSPERAVQPGAVLCVALSGLPCGGICYPGRHLRLTPQRSALGWYVAAPSGRRKIAGNTAAASCRSHITCSH